MKTTSFFDIETTIAKDFPVYSYNDSDHTGKFLVETIQYGKTEIRVRVEELEGEDEGFVGIPVFVVGSSKGEYNRVDWIAHLIGARYVSRRVYDLVYDVEPR